MGHSKASRKRQRKYLTKIYQKNKCCLPLQATVIALFDEEIHPNDLPPKSAYIKLKKFFLYGKPQAKRLFHWLVQTGHFDALIRNKREEDDYAPAANDVDCLLEIVNLLIKYAKYRIVDVNHFDFELGLVDPTLCLIRLLKEVFNLNERITPFVVDHLLTKEGVKLFEQLVSGVNLLKLNKKEEKYLLDAPRTYFLLEAQCYSILRGEGVEEEFAMTLTKLIAKNKAIARAYIAQKGAWRFMIRFFVHCQKMGYAISSEMLYYCYSFIPFSKYWIRPLKDLSLEVLANQEKEHLYNALLNHLFVQYEVPAFLKPNMRQMDFHWTSPTEKLFAYFIHVAQGGNVRNAPDFPYKMSKKEAHFFMQAPQNSNIEIAYRYGQLRAMGASPVLAEYLGKCIGGLRITDEDYCQKVMRFFVQHFPEGHESIKEMILFIGLRRHQNPKFSLKGRTASSFLKLFENFQIELQAFIKNPRNARNRNDQMPNDMLYLKDFKELVNVFANHFPWSKMPIDDFTVSSKERGVECTYRIQQLDSAKLLKVEGSAMQHCVATYVMRCFQGSSSIWSMTSERINGMPERMLTIEVNNKHEIIQIRGFKNRSAKLEEMDLLRLWAKKASLQLN